MNYLMFKSMKIFCWKKTNYGTYINIMVRSNKKWFILSSYRPFRNNRSNNRFKREDCLACWLRSIWKCYERKRRGKLYTKLHRKILWWIKRAVLLQCKVVRLWIRTIHYTRPSKGWRELVDWFIMEGIRLRI